MGATSVLGQQEMPEAHAKSMDSRHQGSNPRSSHTTSDALGTLVHLFEPECPHRTVGLVTAPSGDNCEGSDSSHVCRHMLCDRNSR